MASTIRAPVGRSRRPVYWVGLIYLAGSIGGGAAVGAALGLAGRAFGVLLPLPALVLAVAAVGVRAAVLATSRGWPERRRQIPRWWVYPVTPYGVLLAGLSLGGGLFTHVRYALFYVALVCMVVAGTVNGAVPIVIGGVYGAVNGLTPMLQTGSREQRGSRRYDQLLSGGATLARGVAVAAGAGGIALAGMALLS